MAQRSGLDMYHMIETGLREDMFQVSKTPMHSHRNYMTHYNEYHVSSYIMCLDAHNLYGGCMFEKLPSAVVQWPNAIRAAEVVLHCKSSYHGYNLQ